MSDYPIKYMKAIIKNVVQVGERVSVSVVFPNNIEKTLYFRSDISDSEILTEISNEKNRLEDIEKNCDSLKDRLLNIEI